MFSQMLQVLCINVLPRKSYQQVIFCLQVVVGKCQRAPTGSPVSSVTEKLFGDLEQVVIFSQPKLEDYEGQG